jgi:hypothetical protein
MRTHSLVSAAVLSVGLAFTAPSLLAQEASDGGGPVRRWPSAADRGAGSAPRTIDGVRAGGGERIAVEQGQLEQRRSPGGSGRDGGSVRGGGGQSGGGRVAVPRGSGGGTVRGGRPTGGGGRRVIVQPRGYYYGGFPRYYYPYSSFYWGPGYFDTWGYWGNTWGPGFGYYNGWGGGYPGYAGGYGGYGYRGYDFGRLRLQVEPKDAEVFIDGYYAGEVDDFDGRLQGLSLETGGYNVEIRKDGFETLAFDVRVTPGRTTNYKGELLKRP